MATKPERKYGDGTDLGIKVSGDLGALQIIEDSSDTEDEGLSEQSRTIDTISSLPQGLVLPNSAPVYGSVSVTQSDNVQFGNNTYFNGPVTIKQVIKNGSGIDNASYLQTDDEKSLPSNATHSDKGKDVRKIQVHIWIKITLSAVCIVIIGGVCAIVTTNLMNGNDNSSSPSTNFNEEPTNNIKVVGMCDERVKVIFVTFLLVSLITGLMFYLLITYTFVGDKMSNRKKTLVESNHSTIRYKVIKDDPLLIAPNHLRIVSRNDWLAQPVEDKLDDIRHPIPWVIISHTATESCSTQSECVLRVRLIQMFHIESRKWFDIGYNFLVAGDGSAYYGRGWDYIGAHTLGYNKYSIGISFIGTFNNEAPPQKQLDACEKLIKRGVELGKLDKNYKLFAHRQLASTKSPGDKLFDIIKEWPHFVNITNTDELEIPSY